MGSKFFYICIVTLWIVMVNSFYIGSPYFLAVQNSSLWYNDLYSSIYKIIVYFLPVSFLIIRKLSVYSKKRFCNRKRIKYWWIYLIRIGNAILIVGSKIMMSGSVGVGNLIFGYIYVLVVNTVIEEAVFRGWMQEVSITKYGTHIGILLQSVCFTIVHVPLYIYVDSLSGLVGIWIGGVVFGYMTHYSRSLVPAMILHSIHNGLGIFLKL